MEEFQKGDIVIVTNNIQQKIIGMTGTVIDFIEGSIAVDLGVSIPYVTHTCGGLTPNGGGRYFSNSHLKKIGPVDVGDLEDDF